MRASPCLLAIAGALVAACGNPPPPSALIDGGPRDAQPRDSGPRDADGGGALEDGGPPEDGGGLLDGGGTIDPVSCSADPVTDIFTLATDTPARNRDVGVAAGATGLALTWSARVEGSENIYIAEIGSTGPAAAQQVTSLTFTLRDPVIAANGLGWFLAWHGNPDGDFDPYSLSWLAGRPATGATVQRLSARAGRDDAVAIVSTATGARVAWVETRMETMRVAVTRPLSTAGDPTAAAADASTAAIATPVLGLRSGGLSMAYVETAVPAPDVMLQPLDASGVPAGSPIAISTEGNADGTLDAAASESGGAIVFGTLVAGSRPEVRARVIDGSGFPAGPERVVTEAPRSGRDASITPLAGGYIVAYRELSGATPMLRLAYLADDLDVLGGVDITEVAPTGGRITVRASGEGRLILGWADVVGTTTSIRGARVRCE